MRTLSSDGNPLLPQLIHARQEHKKTFWIITNNVQIYFKIVHISSIKTFVNNSFHNLSSEDTELYFAMNERITEIIQ